MNINGKICGKCWTLDLNTNDATIDLESFDISESYYDSDHELCDPFWLIVYKNNTCRLSVKSLDKKSCHEKAQSTLTSLKIMFNK